MRFTWMLLLGLLLTGCGPIPQDKTNDAEKAAVASELAKHVTKDGDTPTPNPDDPESDVCDNCGGTGQVGDGRVSVVCPVCNGTGKKPKSESSQVFWNPSPQALRDIAIAVNEELRDDFELVRQVRVPCDVESAQMKLKSVVIYSLDGCLPCRNWKRDEKPKLENAGFQVIERPAAKGKVVPYFEIHINSKLYRADSYISAESVLALLKGGE